MQSKLKSFKKTTKNLLQHSIRESSSNQHISPNFPTRFPKRLEKIASENGKKISEEVESRLQPFVEAKSLAESMKFENEERAKQNKILREQNNCIVLENEQFREEIEKLSKFMHIAEDRSEMVKSVKKKFIF